MITDPKTVPAGGASRIVFGVLVAITSVLLMAPQTDEFGSKVGLLAGLVVVCAMRPLLDQFLPAAARVPSGRPQVTRIGALVAAGVLVAVAIVAAGIPARGIVVPDRAEAPEQPTGGDRSHHPAASPSARRSRTMTTSSPHPACRRWWCPWPKTWRSRIRRCWSVTPPC